MSNINFFAKTNFRNNGRVFGIKKEDRRYHMYIIGKTGMGKTTLFMNMIMNDVRNEEGIYDLFIARHLEMDSKQS
ncbi:MAG TPA: hypothetical protein ENI51_09675 [Candidatus Atribacteria bacterium]|nr:hypothetical protein [Candidatus Atribacteria bacterium]